MTEQEKSKKRSTLSLHNRKLKLGSVLLLAFFVAGAGFFYLGYVGGQAAWTPPKFSIDGSTAVASFVIHADTTVTPTMYYAVASNGTICFTSTDCSTVTQDIVDSLPLNTGIIGGTTEGGTNSSSIWFGTGDYIFDSTVNIVNHKIAIYGNGWTETVLHMAPNANCGMWNIGGGTTQYGTEVQFYDLYMDGASLQQTFLSSNCITINSNVKNFQMGSCYINNWAGAPITYTSNQATQDCYIFECSFENSQYGLNLLPMYYLKFNNNYIFNCGNIAGSYSTYYNGMVVASSSAIIDSNSITASGGYGLDIYSTPIISVTNNIIDANNAQNWGKCGMLIQGSSSYPTTSAIIEGNNFGAQTIKQAYDLYISDYVKNFLVEGNIFNDWSKAPICFGDPAAFPSLSNGIIENNLGWTYTHIANPIYAANHVIESCGTTAATTWASGVTYQNAYSPSSIFFTGTGITITVTDSSGTQTLYSSVTSANVQLAPSQQITVTYVKLTSVNVYMNQ